MIYRMIFFSPVLNSDFGTYVYDSDTFTTFILALASPWLHPFPRHGAKFVPFLYVGASKVSVNTTKQNKQIFNVLDGEIHRRIVYFCTLSYYACRLDIDSQPSQCSLHNFTTICMSNYCPSAVSTIVLKLNLACEESR